MRNIARITKISFIYTFIGVFLFCNSSHALRPPISSNNANQTFIKAQNRENKTRSIRDKRPVRETPRKLKVLFFVSSTDMKGLPHRYPIGILSMASAIRSKEFLLKVAQATDRKTLPDSIDSFPDVEVKLIDMGLVSEDFDVGAAISEFGPNIIGVSSMSSSIDSAYEIADIAAEVCPNSLRVIGGIHTTALPEEVMNNSKFQVAFLGEAEESFSELILEEAFYDDPDIGFIDGTYYKDSKNNIYRGETREPVVDLDDYPSIVLSYDIATEYKEYKDKVARLYMTRGCPYNCPFCARGIMRSKVRYRNPKKVVEDLIALYAQGFRDFYFIDDTFTLNKEKLDEFLDELEKAGLKDIQWTVQTRIDKLLLGDKPDIELMKRMKKLGLRDVQLGVETADPELGEKLKPGTLKYLANVTRALNAARIVVTYNLIVGLPGQSWKSLQESFFTLYANRVYSGASAQLSGSAFCVPYPGSPVYNAASSRVVKRDDGKSNFPVFASPELFALTDDPQNFNYGFEVPDLVPVETDVMSSVEISEAYVYNLLFVDALIESKSSQEMTERCYVILKELSTRIGIDNIANSKDAPKGTLRNDRVKELRTKMLKGDFPKGFPNIDLLNFAIMLSKISFVSGYKELSQLDHDALYKLYTLIFNLWVPSPESFNKIEVVNSEKPDEKGLFNKLKEAPDTWGILISIFYDLRPFPIVYKGPKEYLDPFWEKGTPVNLCGIEFSLDKKNKTLKISLNSEKNLKDLVADTGLARNKPTKEEFGALLGKFFASQFGSLPKEVQGKIKIIKGNATDL